MDSSRTLRLAAAGFVVLAIAASALQRRRAPPPADLAAAPARGAAHQTDPLAPELARCQALGEAGAREPACLAAWAESRRRFLGARPRLKGE